GVLGAAVEWLLHAPARGHTRHRDWCVGGRGADRCSARVDAATGGLSAGWWDVSAGRSIAASLSELRLVCAGRIDFVSAGPGALARMAPVRPVLHWHLRGNFTHAARCGVAGFRTGPA